MDHPAARPTPSKPKLVAPTSEERAAAKQAGHKPTASASEPRTKEVVGGSARKEPKAEKGDTKPQLKAPPTALDPAKTAKAKEEKAKKKAKPKVGDEAPTPSESAGPSAKELLSMVNNGYILYKDELAALVALGAQPAAQQSEVC